MSHQNVTVDCHIDRQYLVDTFEALQGCLDDEFTQQLDNSIVANMRNFSFTFDNEKIVRLNKDKNEVSTFYYSDLYQIQETTTGLILFINKIVFEFVRYDLFQPDELVLVKKYLAPYMSKNQEPKIATINFQIDYQRIYELACHVSRNQIKIATMLYILFFVVGLLEVIAKNLLASVLAFILSIIFYSMTRSNLKELAKKQVLTLNEHFRSLTCNFYNDYLTFNYQKKEGSTNINYDEFYKIDKTSKGYVFFIHKNSSYYFFYEEFTLEQQQALEERLKQYNNYSEK